ncbi:aldo-keto reductase [Coccidioides immitis RMSCC 3703]|uniref:Aldo-keto reductase n=1 Tax=Coccidioides immitis RMSCC 3703 TaxID=454286 RepID=A0A0J8TI95_COCIT|nr:aldo-keto reductase [Coccidioides immitis RMSCC 3703]
MAATNLPAFLQESIKKVDYRKLGRSGLKVSVPILGAMSFGSTSWAPWVIEEDKALPLLKAAYDKGLNTWDTANVYSNGISEEIIAKAIEKYSIPREKLVIMTKCWAVVSEHDNVMAFGQNKVYARSKDYVNQLVFLARPPSVEPVTPRAELYLKTNNLTEEDLEIIRRVEEISKKKGRKMSAIAMAWIKSRVTSPIIGFSSIERIDEALTAREVSLTEEEEKYLEEPYRPKKVVGHS